MKRYAISITALLVLAACGQETNDTPAKVASGQKAATTSQDPNTPKTNPQDPVGGSPVGPKGAEKNAPKNDGPDWREDQDAKALRVPEKYRNAGGIVPFAQAHIMLARDPETGDLGGVCTSAVPAMAGRIIRGRADVGIVAVTGKFVGKWHDEILDRLENGEAPAAIVADLTSDNLSNRSRQLAVLAADGRGAVFTGKANPSLSTDEAMEDRVFVLNTSQGPYVITQMKDSWAETAGVPFAERMLAALAAAENKSGTNHGVVSAAMRVYRKDGGPGGTTDEFIDVRVDLLLEPADYLKRVYKESFLAVIGPRLKALNKRISDVNSKLYQSNLAWLRRIKVSYEVGVPQK